jgi:TolB protein
LLKPITRLNRRQTLSAAGLIALLAVAASLTPRADAVVSGENGKIVFASNRTGNYEIWIMNADGSNEKQLTHTPGAANIQPAFSADGKAIVFSSTRDDFGGKKNGDREGDFEIYSMPVSGDEEFGDLKRWTWNSCADKHPAFDPRDEYLTKDTGIVYSTKCGVDGTNSDYKLVTKPWRLHDFGPKLLKNGKGDDLNPSYSPDGRQIVYDGMRTPYLLGIPGAPRRYVIVMDSDGSNDKKIARGQRPAFTPDGDRVGYFADLQGEPFAGLYVVDSDGGGNDGPTGEGVVDGGDDPAYSPDGTRIAYRKSDNIWSALVSGRSSRQLASKGKNVQPDWGVKAP